MPLLAPIYAFILFATPFIVKQIIVLLGISIITYIGVDLVFDQITDAVLNRLGQLPASISNIIGIGGFGIFIKMNLSAVTAALVLRASLGSFRKLRVGG